MIEGSPINPGVWKIRPLSIHVYPQEVFDGRPQAPNLGLEFYFGLLDLADLGLQGINPAANNPECPDETFLFGLVHILSGSEDSF